MTTRKILIALVYTFAAFTLLPLSASADDLEWKLAEGQAALGADSPGKAYGIFQDGMRKAPEDLRFAYLAGIAAERSGKLDAALAHLTQADTAAGRKAFRTLDFDIGRVLFLQGQMAEAEKRLAAYTSSNADDALGFIWLAEAKLAQGKDEEAFNAFNRAGKPEPRLRPIFHFTRGTRIFTTNPNEAAEEMKRAIAADRDGRIAEKAREFTELAEKRQELERWYSVDAALGFQNDSNMLQNTEADGTLRYSGQRAVFSAAAFARPKLGERFFLGIGANLNQAQTISAKATGRLPSGIAPKRDNKFFNVASHTFFIDGALYYSFETFSLEPGLEYAFHYGGLGGETSDLTHSVYPRLTWFHSSNSASKVYAIVQAQGIYAIDDLAPLADERSGLLLGGGIAEYLVFSDRLDAVTGFVEFVSKSSDSDADSYAGPRGGINGRKRIVADLYLDAGVLAAYRSYADSPDHESDLLFSADGGPGYLLFKHLEIDLNASYTKNISDEKFAYDRLLTGIFIRGIF